MADLSPIHPGDASSDSSQASKPVVHHAMDDMPLFLRAMAYSGLQNPVNALAQIADQCGAHVQSHVQFVNAPEAGTSFLDKVKLTGGSAIGQLIPYAIGGAASKKMLGMAGFEAGAARLGSGAFSLNVGEAALTGGLTGLVLTPSQDGHNFWESRAYNSLAGAATLSLMTAGAMKMKGMGETVPLFKSDAAVSAIAGFPAGALNVQMDSLIQGQDHKFASLPQTLESGATMSLLGGAFGAISDARAVKNYYASDARPTVPTDLKLPRLETLATTTGGAAGGAAGEVPAITTQAADVIREPSPDVREPAALKTPAERLRTISTDNALANASESGGIPNHWRIRTHIDGHYEDGLWIENKPLSHLSEAELMEAAQPLAKEYSLFDPARYKDFVNTIDGIVRGAPESRAELQSLWLQEADLKQHCADWSSNYEEAFRAIEIAQKQAIRSGRLQPDEQLPGGYTLEELRDNPVMVKKFFNENAEFLGPTTVAMHKWVVDDFADNFSKWEQVHNQLAERLDQTKEQLQKSIEQYYTQKTGTGRAIASPKVEIGSEAGDAGSFSERNGTVRVNRDTLMYRDPAQVDDTIIHELTHNEQQQLMVAKLADDMHLGKEPTDAELETLRRRLLNEIRPDTDSVLHEYYLLYGQKPDAQMLTQWQQTIDEKIPLPSIEWLRDMVRTRDGQPLTAQERDGAEAIALSRRTGRNVPPAYQRTTGDFRTITSMIGDLEGADGAREVLTNWATIKELGSESAGYGDEQFDRAVEELGKKLSQSGKPTVQDAHEIRPQLIELLKQRLDTINDFRQTSWAFYMGAKYEWDAYSLGSLTQRLVAQTHPPVESQPLLEAANQHVGLNADADVQRFLNLIARRRDAGSQF